MKNEIVKMGPAYIKMGQLVASRIYIFEKEYIEELQDLHDNVDPINILTNLSNVGRCVRYTRRHILNYS